MNFLPIFLRIRARPCLVVGGGEVAARKVSLLQQTGTNVSVVSPTLCKSLASERPRTTSVIVTLEILDLTRRDAERIRVGKQRDYHGARQNEINQLMVRLAEPANAYCGLRAVTHSFSAAVVKQSVLHRNPSYPSGLYAVLRVRYRTHGPELGCASAATTDDRDLHGSKRTYTFVSTADKTWNVFRYAGSTYRTGHYTASAGFCLAP